ncbi:hypothetical protein FA95DRAFT_788245 [Auriscalpium vulgare]|uniref:Uncharacterized protein n=1 Tax=Auriscalpium vulgare TaxID=40419 RepID=A0ACB8RAN9_9AGAM|nr:hypothetical protein FA95DRAFT_788245 [Auriscalpium vulgare]
MTSASLRKGAVLTRALVRRFLAYGEAVLAHCATLAASTHVPYSRMQASDDLRAIICGLQPTSGIGAMLADLEASMPKSARKLIRQAQKASEKHERSLKATLSYLSEKLRNLNEAPALTLEQLMAERDAWRKRKDMVEDALVTLEKRACGDDAYSIPRRGRSAKLFGQLAAPSKFHFGSA